MHFLSLALKLARRDLRGALGSFWILVAGIAIGVAAIAATGSLAGAVLDGVRAGARESIGGDVSLRLFHRPATPEERTFLAATAAHSETAELRPLARRADGTRPTLVELKGVDGPYPLYGTVSLDPAMPLAESLEARDGRWGAAVDANLLGDMDLSPGETLRLGAVEVELRAVILAEPDRALRAFSLGPRVIVARAALEASGLAPVGAQVYWYNRVRLAEGQDAAAWIAETERRFPDAGWRIVNAADGVPGVERSVRLGTVLLVVVGLAALLIGGVGVGSAVAAHLARKTATIAVLKALGAPARLIFAIYLAQVMAASAAGVALGLAVGVAAPAAARPYIADLLPLAEGPALQPAALAVAAGFGMLTALLFALWPLAQAEQSTPQQLFREVVAPPGWRPRARPLLAIGAAATALVALLLATSEMPLFAGLFAAGAALTVLLFLGLGKAVAWAAARVRGVRRPMLRLALANLHRPGAATGPIVMALGLSLTLLIAVKTIEGNAARHLAGSLPDQAPDLVFINLPPERGAEFDTAAMAVPGVARVQRVPFLHAQLTEIGGVPTWHRRVPADIAWVARGDRGLSWAAEPPPGSRVTAGAWWPEGYSGAPLASLDETVARRLGIGVGDTLTLNILGRPVEARIANLRRIDWTGLGLDFPILLSPPPEPPPHSEVAALWAGADALASAEAALLTRFPESPAIRVAPVLATIGGMVGGIADALAATSGLTVAAALVVLAGSVAAGYRRRVREMVLLKVIGARPRQLALACVLEFVLLGLATSAVATVTGTAAAFAVLRQAMPETWAFLPAVPAALAALAVAVLAATGLALSLRTLHRSPGPLLRQRFPAG